MGKNADEFAEAVEKSRFDQLRNQEKESGFREKLPGVKMFFREGMLGGWRGILNGEQIGAVIEANRKSMERLDYSSENGELVGGGSLSI